MYTADITEFAGLFEEIETDVDDPNKEFPKVFLTVHYADFLPRGGLWREKVPGPLCVTKSSCARRLGF